MDNYSKSGLDERVLVYVAMDAQSSSNQGCDQ